MQLNDKIKSKIVEILKSIDESFDESTVLLTSNKDNSHGDLSTNVALRNAKKFNMQPLQLANLIKDKFFCDEVTNVEVAGVGFINFYLKSDTLGSIIDEIIKADENYGQSFKDKDNKVNLEYVSANPTGYLHLGHARGAALGDAMSRILKKAGYEVLREYYINDAGNQVNMLGKSLMVRYQQALNLKNRMPSKGYHGEEIKIVAKSLVEQYGDKYAKKTIQNLKFFIDNGIKFLLNQILVDLKQFRVEFDNFVSEQWIRNSNRIELCLERLKPYIYVQDGATFLNTTKDKDDKDRVIVKSDGSYSYFMPDIAYHDYKFERGFDKIITLLGADHHGYITRLKSAMTSLGHDATKLNIPLIQMVRLFKNGKEFKMSKRTGNAISMKELINMVGIDAARYFFVSRSASQHLDFDLDLAMTIGNTNPVYYAQYTHARLCSILNKAKDKNISEYDTKADLLNSESEKSLIKSLYDFPKVVQDAAKTLEPYKICNYIQEVCTLVNVFYQKNKVVDEENLTLSKQRLALVFATDIVLKNAFNLIAIDAPEKM